MIIDLNEADTRGRSYQYDVCIGGTGPAGITVARHLASRGKRVALLEAGGLRHTVESQSIYEGENVGRTYWGLASCRTRYFGGTSNHWAGRCGLLDPIDFEQRKYFGMPGWPITREEILQYLEPARSILDLGDQSLTSPEHPRWKSSLFKLDGKAFSPPTRFKEKYHRELARSDQIDILINANIVDILLNDGLNHVTTFKVKNYKNETMFVSADVFVLALGAIENARILLSADNQVQNGIGNRADLVGRCFMEHLNVPMGRFVSTDRQYWSIDKNSTERQVAKFLFRPTERLMRKANIGNAVIVFSPRAEPRSYGRTKHIKQVLRNTICKSEVFTEFSRELIDFDCPGDGVISSLCEQTPNINSRITLGEERDRLGLRRARLDWQFSENDFNTIRTLAIESAKEMARLDLARVQLREFILDEEIETEAGGHCHHMGTTRMSEKSHFGVVDQNLKVHGLDNLYVAGSSVFPTGGGTNPTLIIVMLSLRLGEYLEHLP